VACPPLLACSWGRGLKDLRPCLHLAGTRAFAWLSVREEGYGDSAPVCQTV
jgi:hypothetical protein